jgi:hypothetical protein
MPWIFIAKERDLLCIPKSADSDLNQNDLSPTYKKNMTRLSL